MSLPKISKPFQYIFYLLAQNPFPSVALSSSNIFYRLLLALPVLLLISITLYVTLYSLNNDQHATSENKARELIHVLLIISSSVTNLITAYQCTFLSKTWAELQMSLEKLEKEFQDALPNIKVNFTKFRNHYLIKCSVMFILYFFSIFSMFMSRSADTKINSYMFVLVLINDFNAFQVIFYVDLIKLFLKTKTQAINDVFVGCLDKCSNKKPIGSKLMSSMRKLHLNVWKTVERLNKYFGLFLLGYIVQQFLVISFDIYWIFLNKFNVGVWLSMDNAFGFICAMFSLFFVSNSCDKIHVEAQKSITFLYETEELLTLTDSQHTQFLSQIMSQPINITAKGFYTLNRSFFASLTVGSLTSAIILVQFQRDDDLTPKPN